MMYLFIEKLLQSKYEIDFELYATIGYIIRIKNGQT